MDDERTEREVCVRLRGRHLKERSAASPKTSFGVRLSRIHEARKEGVPWPRPSRASFHQAKASNKCTTGLAWVDYEQPLFFLGHSSKTRETRKWPRASRFSRRHSHSRALPWLKFCSLSVREGKIDLSRADWSRTINYAKWSWRNFSSGERDFSYGEFSTEMDVKNWQCYCKK